MTDDLVDDPTRCEWHFLSSASLGDGGVWVMTGTHAGGSQYRGHLGSRAVESLHGITSSYLRTISSNGRNLFHTLDESRPFLFLSEESFLALIEERCRL